MEYLTVHVSELVEACPATASAEDFARLFHVPSEHQFQTLFSRTVPGRMHPSLADDSIVQWGDALGTLAAAAIFHLLANGNASAPVWFGGADNPDLWQAIADLAVTGSENYWSLEQAATISIDGTELRSPAVLSARLEEGLAAAASRLGVTLRGDPELERAAMAAVVDRAMRVAWALNGPAAHRAEVRPGLGWIAVNSERDQARRPVNVPAAEWPTADIVITVDLPAGARDLRIRYAIGGAAEADAAVDVANGFPRVDRPPRLDPEADVFVFLHGHSSRLEEAGGFHAHLAEEAAALGYPRPVATLSFDFPSNGYSEYVDHDELMPLGTTTHYVPDRPQERRFGILEFYEKVVCSLVDALDVALRADGQPGLKHRVVGVMGGSMGGNLTMRLAERLSSMPWWMQHALAWSPASAYESFGNKDYLIPSPGEEVDPIGKEALERVHQRCQHGESADSRSEFMALQIVGERLLNDGTPEFEVGARVAAFLLEQLLPFIPIVGEIAGPLLAGVAGSTVLGTAVLEGKYASYSALRQSDTWVRAECRAGYDQGLKELGGTIELNERYSSTRRRTHWRVAYEQLLFSHQDVIAASEGVPAFKRIQMPLLLVAGGDDTVDRLTGFDIVGGVRTMAAQMNVPDGRVVVVEKTGHSIHDERPRWLARQMIDFIMTREPRRVVAISRAHGDTGRITRLHFESIVRHRSVDAGFAFRRSMAYPGGYYYLTSADHGRHQILARRYLCTSPDNLPTNNLRALPETALAPVARPPGAQPAVFGPISGFQVTHIRLHTVSPEPWGTWVSHLCNDELGLQIPTAEAEVRVVQLGARYYLRIDGIEHELHVVEMLYTGPDGIASNNLGSLPVIPEVGR